VQIIVIANTAPL